MAYKSYALRKRENDELVVKRKGENNMSIVKTNGSAYYEDSQVKNYAVEFAKRECGRLEDAARLHAEKEVLDHPDGSVTEVKLANGSVSTEKLCDGSVTEEKIADYSIGSDKISDSLMETIDLALNTAETANLNANSALKKTAEQIGSERLSEEVTEKFTIKPAAADTLGGIKPLYKSVNGKKTNRSGLAVSEDGTTYIATSNGIKLNGSGQVVIDAATDEEIDGGTQGYKPITANAFARFINYFETPQRVGMWIDGTPIWRWAVDRELTAEEISDIKLMADDDDNFSLSLPVENREAAFVVDEFICQCAATNLIDTKRCRHYGGDIWKADAGMADNFNRIYGWVEFATEQANLAS